MPLRTLQISPHLLGIRAENDGTLGIEGLAAPYGQTIEYAGQRESFAEGAFDPEEASDVPILWGHDRSEPVGHTTEAANTSEGLTFGGVVLPTSRGRDAITVLKSGSRALRGVSVGFEPIEWTTTADGAITYTKARLHEMSLTPLPAYQDAGVTNTRQKGQEGPSEPSKKEEAQMPTDLTDEGISALKQRMDAFESSLTTAMTPKTPTKYLSVREAFILQLADAKEGKIRALADVISSGNSGLLPPQWSAEVRSVFDSQRYMVPRVGQMAFPSVGHTLTVPKVTQHTTVTARGTEKSDIPSRALTTSQDTYTATWYAGGVDIGLEVIAQSDPSILALVVEDLFAQYAAVTDQALTSAMEAAGQALGAVLDFTSYGAFVDQVMSVNRASLVNTGAPGNLLSLTSDSWGKLIGLVDADGRRLLSTTGSTNADGSAGLLSTSVDVGGITCFWNPRASQDMQFNTVAIRVAEKPPTQITSVNVQKAGQDIGVLGALMDLPLYPNGIMRYALTTTTAASKK